MAFRHSWCFFWSYWTSIPNRGSNWVFFGFLLFVYWCFWEVWSSGLLSWGWNVSIRSSLAPHVKQGKCMDSNSCNTYWIVWPRTTISYWWFKTMKYVLRFAPVNSRKSMEVSMGFCRKKIYKCWHFHIYVDLLEGLKNYNCNPIIVAGL